MIVLFLALVACVKQPQVDAPEPPVSDASSGELWGTDEAGPPPLPDGWTRSELPFGVRSLRVVAGHTTEDGSITLAGSAVKVAQYQWLLRVPSIGDPAHLVLDPGRVEQVRENGTGGMMAVGVLGGVPEDKAWYGDIDAFGNVTSRQTYLSDRDGSLRAMAPLNPGLLLAGEVMGEDDKQHGWLIRVDQSGRDEWKKSLGDGETQALLWGENAGGVFVAVGYQGDTDEDAWVLAVDGSGDVLVDLRFKEPSWTRLTGGALLSNGDLLGVGLRGPNQTADMDGNGALLAVRVAPDGTIGWEREERGDLSRVTDATPWKGGAAVAALTGALGTERGIAVATITESGDVSWQDVDLGLAPDWARVVTAGNKLVLIAAITDEHGVAWTRRVLD